MPVDESHHFQLTDVYRYTGRYGANLGDEHEYK